jgi:predicted metal-dependent peptidase
MKAINQTGEDGHWLEDLLYYLIAKKQFDYCYVLHHVNIVAVSTPPGFSGRYPIHACCGIDKSGQICLYLYWPVVSRLSFEARLELLQHETLHIIEGHLSSYGKRLIDTYGASLANAAMDIYVNQKFSRTQLTAEGLPGTQLEHFKGLPPNKSSLEYAEMLQKLVNEGKLSFPKFSLVGTDPLAGTSGQPGDDFTGKGVKGLMSELLQLDEANVEFAEEQVKNIITSVTEALKMHDSAVAKRWRGLHGADHKEFMKASQRRTKIPWSHYLRSMESQHRFDVRTPTRRRPSRRHPSYHGYTWLGGLDVAFLIDTSGSMGAEELKLVDPELRGMHARGAHITVIHSDAGVSKVHRYHPGEPLQNFFGRGGTDYSDALGYISQMHPRPRYVVGFTDGYGSIGTYRSNIIKERGQNWWDEYISSNPEKSPDGFRTMWLLPEGCMPAEDFKRNIVPWGTVVIVERDRV